MKKRSLLLNQENPRASLYFKLKLFASILVVCAFAALAWYSYDTQISNIKESELPLIKAPTEPMKVKPDDPGGLKINHQDKEIYEHISGNKNSTKTKIVDKNYKPATHEKIKKTVKKQIKTKKIVPEKKSPEIKPVIINIPKAKTTKTVKKVVPAKKYYIRIASLKSAAVKDKAWDIMKKKYPTIAKLSPKITQIRKNNKVAYFLDAGPINQVAEAKNICESIKKSGGKCKIY